MRFLRVKSRVSGAIRDIPYREIPGSHYVEQPIDQVHRNEDVVMSWSSTAPTGSIRDLAARTCEQAFHHGESCEDFDARMDRKMRADLAPAAAPSRGRTTRPWSEVRRPETPERKDRIDVAIADMERAETAMVRNVALAEAVTAIELVSRPSGQWDAGTYEPWSKGYVAGQRAALDAVNDLRT